MNSNKSDIEILEKAKVIFISESKKHLKQLLDDIKLKIIPTKTEFIVLESVFIEDFRVKAHTIRGGAGFFHLKEVVLISEEIEEYFKKISGGKPKVKKIDLIKISEKLELLQNLIT